MLKRNAVIRPEVFALRENHAELMLLVRIIESRMNFHAVKQHGRAETSGQINVQTADNTKTVFVSSVSDADIRRNRQLRFALQIFARRGVKRLSAWRSDAVAARA